MISLSHCFVFYKMKKFVGEFLKASTKPNLFFLSFGHSNFISHFHS